MYDFNDRVAIVTGAATGLGKAIATRLLDEGAAVTLVDLDRDGLEATVDELSQRSDKVLGWVANVTSADEVVAAIKATENAFGPANTLVNNAGVAVLKKYIDHSDDEFDRQIDVNLRGTHLFMSRLLPGMIQRHDGAIVNIASVAAIHYTAPHAAYAASKAGVIALTRDTAFEVARHGVRVNCVAPGLIAVPPSATKQPYLQTQTTSSGTTDLEVGTSTRPLGYGRPTDIANAVAFLVSSEARFIVGVTLSVCGGTDLQVSMAYPGE